MVWMGLRGVDIIISYLSWNGEADMVTKKAEMMREEGVEEKIWEHTQKAFRRICDKGGRYRMIGVVVSEALINSEILLRSDYIFSWQIK